MSWLASLCQLLSEYSFDHWGPPRGLEERGHLFQGTKGLNMRGTKAIWGNREYKKARFWFWGTEEKRNLFQGNKEQVPPWEGLTTEGHQLNINSYHSSTESSESGQCGFTVGLQMCRSKDADRMAKRIHPDQTAPTLFALTSLSEKFGIDLWQTWEINIF